MTLSKLIKELYPQLTDQQIIKITAIFKEAVGYGANRAVPQKVVNTMRKAKCLLGGF